MVYSNPSEIKKITTVQTQKALKADIIKLASIINKIESRDQQKLSPQIIQLRHFVFFIHETIHSNLQFLVTEAIYGIKEPRNIMRLASKIYTTSHVLKLLDFKPTVDACISMSLLLPKEAEIIHKVNKHRNRFGHLNQHKRKLKEYEDLVKYKQVLYDLLIALNTEKNASSRYHKRIPRRAYSLKDLGKRLSLELDKTVTFK